MSRRKRRHFRRRLPALDIPGKANRILNIVLIGMILILVRVWHLAVIQYDDKVQEAARPRKRVVIVPAKRATIRDRFNIPLAVNKVKYEAAVYYSQIKEIPSVKWEVGDGGKKIKKFKRREYIEKFSELLGVELGMDFERIEDLIHSKAVFFHNIPFVLKEDISEATYYRLKMLEKDWPGICARRVPKREYPWGPVASDIIGYMGSINRSEYEAIIGEINSLRTALEEYEEGEEPKWPEGFETVQQVKNRLRNLEEHAYSINDYVGKSGIEGKCEDNLRGYWGKKVFYSDAKGHFLHELPGARTPRAGNRLLLTISAELQEYAEKLLIRNEKIRASSSDEGVSFPWIRGGAIVAMDPKNGEVLALAGHPRFDPNDFIASGNSALDLKKQKNIVKWFEDDNYVGRIWDQLVPLEKEEYDPEAGSTGKKSLYLTWESYLDFILPEKHEVRDALRTVGNLSGAVELQRDVESMLHLSGQGNLYAVFDAVYRDEKTIPYKNDWDEEVVSTIKEAVDSRPAEFFALRRKLEPYFSSVKDNYNKVFVVDLCRILVQHEFFSSPLLKVVGGQSFAEYRSLSSAYAALGREVKEMVRILYHEHHFKPWRSEHQKEFLRQKREDEVARGVYAKPYLDYLDQVEKEHFISFWERSRFDILHCFLTGRGLASSLELKPYRDYFLSWHKEISQGAHQGLPWLGHYRKLGRQLGGMEETLADRYLKSMRSFDELDRPLLGKYRNLRRKNNRCLEKHLASAFYPRYGYGFARSHAYRQASIQGSIFKLVTAYEALVQRYYKGVGLHRMNPLEIVDKVEKAGNTWRIGYFADGRPIPRVYKGGRMPKSLSRNIGKTDLVTAIERSSNPYFALLAGDCLESPEDLSSAARLFGYGNRTGIDLPGEIAGKVPDDLDADRTNLYATAIGQGSLVVTPLQTSVMLSTFANGGDVLKPKIIKLSVGGRAQADKQQFEYQESLAYAGIDFPLFSLESECGRESAVFETPIVVDRQIDMPGPIREMIFQGMRRALQAAGPSGFAYLYENDQEAIEAYKRMRPFMIGKTSSSESMEQINLSRKEGVKKTTHGWFGCVALDENDDPELVVVVYLRFAGRGKDAIPLAAQIIDKWRQIKTNQP